MKRSLGKWIEQGEEIIQKNERVDMTTKELQELYERSSGGKDIFNLIHETFLFGVCIGSKINKGA